MARIRTLLASLGVLALAACAPSDSDGEESSGSSSFGFELAIAKPNGADAVLASSVRDLSAQDVALFVESGHGRLIDVRTPEEFAEGHIDGAILMPLDAFDPSQIEDDPSMTVILYCRSGRRSRIAGEQLAQHWGKEVDHLEGGIIAWQEAGQPIIID